MYINIGVAFVYRYNIKTNFYIQRCLLTLYINLKVATRGKHCPGHSSGAGSVITHPAVTPLVNNCSY